MKEKIIEDWAMEQLEPLVKKIDEVIFEAFLNSYEDAQQCPTS